MTDRISDGDEQTEDDERAADEQRRCRQADVRPAARRRTPVTRDSLDRLYRRVHR